MSGCRQYPRAVGLTVNEDDNANLDGLQARPEKLITVQFKVQKKLTMRHSYR